MAGPVTLDDVAARAGVSRWTVAAAIRGRGRVNAGTATRLRALATEMGYDPALTQAGRSLAEARHGRQTRHHLVAIVLPADYIDLPYYAGMLRGSLLGLAEGGSSGVLSDLWRVMFSGIPDEARYGAALLRGRVDAAILHPTDHDATERLLAGWRQGRFGDRPVVTLVRRLAGLPCAGVVSEPAQLAALEYVAARGHRCVAHLHWDGDTEAAGQQRSAWAATLARSSMKASPPPPAIPQAWNSPRSAPHRPGQANTIDHGAEADLLTWLRANPQVTALFAPNDPSALHLVAALARTGLRVPDDISVIGCDGTDDLADGGATPFLATLATDLAEVGRTAAKLALAMVDGEPASDAATASTFRPGRSIGARPSG